MASLFDCGCDAFVEIGPQPILTGMARGDAPAGDHLWVPSLRAGQNDWQHLLQSVVQLFARGASIDWRAFDRDYVRRKVSTPTYPFQRQRHWMPEADVSAASRERRKLAGHHPLLGGRLRSVLAEIQFESEIDVRAPGFLRDHRIYDTAVVPATAYLEVALAAGAEVLRTTDLVLNDVVIQQPLILAGDEARTLQTVLTPAAEGFSFKIFSQPSSGEGAWTLHASGRMQPRSGRDRAMDARQLQESCAEAVPLDDFYRDFAAKGIEYGPAFRGLTDLRREGLTAVGTLALPEPAGKTGAYRMHPVLLDAALQTLGAPFAGQGNSALFLPVGVKSLAFFREFGSGGWCHASIHQPRDASPQSLTADLRVFNVNGDLAVEIEGLTLARASRVALRKAVRKDLDDWLYRIAWEAQERQPVKEDCDGTWLILGQPGDLRKALLDTLETRGARAVGADVLPPDLDKYADVLPPDLDKYDAVVCLCHSSLEQENGLPSLRRDIAGATGIVLRLVQALAQAPRKPRLWLVTRGAVAVSDHECPDVRQAPVWGLARVIALEHPELRCARVDLDRSKSDRLCAEALIEELLASGVEDQIALRGTARYAARLVRLGFALAAGSYRLRMTEFGLLDNLSLEPMTAPTPGPGEVIIVPVASGLNFRDVLHALGLLREFSARRGVTNASEMPFGFECAGVIAAAGEGVSEFHRGDEVIALTLGALNAPVIAPASMVARKPARLSFEQAAALPLAGLTAHYALHGLARIRPGERVLVHAAAGGVGVAAVQIALRAGAEVFATASPAKWDFLKSLGLRHIMNSRTIDFAAQIGALTDGQGVDVVLNSLSGEFIAKSFDALSERGRFVEIGKIGIWTSEEVATRKPGASYFAFDLGEVAQADPALIGNMLRDLAATFESGDLAPLPHTAFAIEEAAEAFRYMAQAKHIGKVVITHPQQDAAPLVRPDGSYLITGGMGSLGLLVARRLGELGASRLVLAGRGAPSAEAQEQMRRLERAGVQVIVARADVAAEDGAADLIAAARSERFPLRGIVHAAGVLDDGLLLGQTWERFEAVMAPKVSGAWNLHALTRDETLDFFVCFSSIASVLGSPGQGNYAAANAFLDALAQRRRAASLPALSIAWGPWAETGMAARLDERSRARMATQGLRLITPQRGLEFLEDLMRRPVSQAAVFDLDWSRFLAASAQVSEWPLIARFARQRPARPAAPSNVLSELRAAPERERRGRLLTYLRTRIAGVLGLPSYEHVAPRQRLFDLGLDSLVAVEMKNLLEADLAWVLPLTLIFDYPTVESLAKYLAQQVLGASAEPKPQALGAEPAPQAAAQSELEHLTEEELALQVAQELSSIEEERAQ
jgi:myxalamid-type polyketide synthase MxaB